MTAGSPTLLVREACKRYGATTAVERVSFELLPGELVGLLGPNGAGKSTLVKLACGLSRPTSGELLVAGHRAGTARARAAIGYLAELFRFPSWLTASEVLGLHQKLARSGGGAAERARLLELVGLGDPVLADRRVGNFSKGMQQRLGIAQALVGEPRLVLLDEPTSALDPAGRRLVREILDSLRERGISVVLNSHLLGEVERSCDRVLIMQRGSVVRAGTPAELTHARGVEVELASGPRSFDTATREDVPRIVRDLVAGGEDVFGVRVLRSSLEEEYLAALGDDATAEGTGE